MLSLTGYNLYRLVYVAIVSGSVSLILVVHVRLQRPQGRRQCIGTEVKQVH